jgi:MarR family transcriptional regulator, temperature-dependent positive regulator of motility
VNSAWLTEMAAMKKNKPRASAKTKSQPVLKPVLMGSLGHLLRRAEQRAMSIYTKEVGASGLTPRQYVVLTAVAAYEGQTQTDLVNATGIDRSTLADMIARMIDNGLLARERTKGDGRANSVTLTTAGKRQLTATTAKVRNAEKRIVAPVPTSKRGMLMDCLLALGDIKDESKTGGSAKTRRR